MDTVKWSGRYVKPGEPPAWVAVEVESEESAARRALPPATDGWTLDAVVRGDHSEGSSELPPAGAVDADSSGNSVPEG